MSTYCVRADIEVRYGRTNVSEWADINNEAISTDIDSMVSEAISVVCDDIDDLLRASSYQIPCANEQGTTPTTIKDLAAWAAGLWLYEARGSMEMDSEGRPRHRYSHVRQYVDQRLEAIRSGMRVLNAKR
jgi:hypothetical protein